MLVVRFGYETHQGFGRLDEGMIHEMVPSIGKRQDYTGRKYPRDSVRLLAPVRPSKIVAAGRNYAEHVADMEYTAPTEPAIFLKPPSSVIGPGEDVRLPSPDLTGDVEHEAELAVVIGTRAKHVSYDDALNVVFGYTCANDLSARRLQRQDVQNARAKGFDTFCPVGPWIQTDFDADEGARLHCWVNGDQRQSSHTTQMLFDVRTLISHISQVMTLCPGDLILTGSPGGTTALHSGDHVTVEIEGIGALDNGVVMDDQESAAH